MKKTIFTLVAFVSLSAFAQDSDYEKCVNKATSEIYSTSQVAKYEKKIRKEIKDANGNAAAIRAAQVKLIELTQPIIEIASKVCEFKPIDF